MRLFTLLTFVLLQLFSYQTDDIIMQPIASCSF